MKTSHIFWGVFFISIGGFSSAWQFNSFKFYLAFCLEVLANGFGVNRSFNISKKSNW